MTQKAKTKSKIMGIQCTVCKDCKRINYVTRINDSNVDTKTFTTKKYCLKCKKHVVHKLVKLK